MESEKVKEIKKALQYNVLGEFMNRLPYGDEFNKLKMVSFEDIITLINELEECSKKWQKLCADEVALNKPLKERIKELESENKELNNELKRYKMDWLNSEKMHLQADMEDTEFELFCANKSLNEVRAENKQLKDRIAELEKEVEDRKAEVLHLQEYGKALIRETELKQFAEMLKENITIWYPSVIESIDDTLKEFIGE